jgi:hypothetical protein
MDATREPSTGVLTPFRIPLQVFEFEEIKEALEYLKAAAFAGKIVIQMPEDTR